MVSIYKSDKEELTSRMGLTLTDTESDGYKRRKNKVRTIIIDLEGTDLPIVPIDRTELVFAPIDRRESQLSNGGKTSSVGSISTSMVANYGDRCIVRHLL